MTAKDDQTREQLGDLATDLYSDPPPPNGADSTPNSPSPGPTDPAPPPTPPEDGTGDPPQNEEKSAPTIPLTTYEVGDGRIHPADPPVEPDEDPWREDVLEAAAAVDKAEGALATAKERHKAAKDAFDAAVSTLREAIAAVDTPRLPLQPGGPDEERDPGPEFAKCPINDLDISVGLHNVLRNYGIDTLGEVRENIKAGTLADFPKIGEVNANLIGEAMGKLVARFFEIADGKKTLPRTVSELGACPIELLTLPERLAQALFDAELLIVDDVQERIDQKTLDSVENVGPSGMKMVQRAIADLAEEFPEGDDAAFGKCSVLRLDVAESLRDELLALKMKTVSDVQQLLRSGTLPSSGICVADLTDISKALSKLSQTFREDPAPPEARTVRVVSCDEKAFARTTISELILPDATLRVLDKLGYLTCGPLQAALDNESLAKQKGIGPKRHDDISHALDVERAKHNTLSAPVETDQQAEAP